MRVEIFESLAVRSGAGRVVEVEASNLRDLLAALGKKYPGMKPTLDRGVSVAIDGRIYTQDLFREIGPENEIVLIPQLRGG